MIGRKSVPESTPVAPVQEPMQGSGRCTRPTASSPPASLAARPRPSAAIRRLARQLVSMGRTSHWMKDRKGKDVYVDGEFFYERDKPMRRWVELDGYTGLIALFDEGKRDPDPEPLGTYSRRNVLPGRFQPSGEDQRRPV